jgi:hypothetical protein
MDNELSQSVRSKEKTHTQHFGAHSGSHAGLSDYHDGGKDESFASEDEDEENDFDGKVAYGNDNESPDEEEDYGKYHSGL